MKIGVSAITGKMGLTIAQTVQNNPICELSSGLVRLGNGFCGQDIGQFLGYEKSGFVITDQLLQFIDSADAIIDFSSPTLSLQLAELCSKQQKILVCGTTGFSSAEKQKLAEFAKNTAIVWSANMSLGVNLLMNLVEQTAKILHDDFDIEVVEMHHNKKVDAPSGTALSLGLAAANGRNVGLNNVANTNRCNANSARKKGEIGFATLRGGDVVGDHTVIFAGDGERLELTHKASNRYIFASGAVRAAIWASAKSAGFYSMQDVLK